MSRVFSYDVLLIISICTTYHRVGCSAESFNRLAIFINQELGPVPFDRTENNNNNEKILIKMSTSYNQIQDKTQPRRNEIKIGLNVHLLTTYSKRNPDCFILRYFHKGWALSPLTSIFAKRSNFAPYLPEQPDNIHTHEYTNSFIYILNTSIKIIFNIIFNHEPWTHPVQTP